jgi:quinol monooxygenase YgiN/anti-anti-sigma regulatory factor
VRVNALSAGSAGCETQRLMQTIALVRITPSAPVSPEALRLFRRTAERVRRMPGFRRWQTYRSLSAPDAAFVAVEWTSGRALQAALRELDWARLVARAAALGFQIGSVHRLTRSFDRSWKEQFCEASLLRVGASATPVRGGASRDNDFALQALAAPGSTRAFGARCNAGQVAICRVDFDSEDALWPFLESPLRKKWTERAEVVREQEVWAINLPRLDFVPALVPDVAPEETAPTQPLKIQMVISEDGTMVRVKFDGAARGEAARRFERMCETFFGDGSRQLEVDLSGLPDVPPDMLMMLVRTARHLKERGGQFVLIDDEERVKRIARSKHLQQSTR